MTSASDGALMGSPTIEAAPSLWQDLRRNRPALLAAALLTAFMLAAAGAPLVAPHDPFQQDLDRRLQPPVWANHVSDQQPTDPNDINDSAISTA